MAKRHFRLSRFLPSLLLVALAAFTLAAAPALAAPVSPFTQEMAAGTGDPCAGMAGKSSHSQGNHAGQCLASCLSVHVALIPSMPSSPDEGPHTDVACVNFIVRKLADHPHGIDPPPPRAA